MTSNAGSRNRGAQARAGAEDGAPGVRPVSAPEAVPVLVIAGPTASGKSGAALAAAERFGGTVINADSMQVYRELRVLTARPSPEDEARAPHALYGVLSAAAGCTAVRWRDMAREAIADAHGAGRLPILCGGTGLYLKALMEGLSPVPEVPAEVRAAVRARAEGVETAALHEALAAKGDPAADRIPPTDRQRLLRALEVRAATGRSLSDWQAAPPDGPPDGLRFASVLFDPPRDALYAACDARFERMVGDGALEEVRRLVRMDLDPSLPAMKALGIAELAAHLRGEISLETAIAQVQQATRRYAKRQVTWFRNQFVSNFVINKQYSKRLNEEIFAFILKKRLTESG